MAKIGDNKRIVLNTATIYVRLIITMGVALFSTRYILEALGETDYGLYNVIAGVVSMFAFIAATMGTTTQRFISYTMGQTRNLDDLRRVIGSSYTIHFLVALIVASIVLIGGYLVIDNLLTIPPGRHADAIFVLFSVCIGLIGTILLVPFEALLMAHENILFVSICQIINAFIKLAGAILLLHLHNVDLLRVYAVIMTALPLLLLLMQATFCLLKYPEAKVSSSNLKPNTLMKQLGRFAGWVMLGTTSLTLRIQGISILLNIFWGVTVNAANGVANQVNSTVLYFATSLTTSIRPQLVKSAGENNSTRFMSLIFGICKYPVLLLSIVAIPLYVAMPCVLSLWLTEVPDFTVQFCRMLIIYSIIRQITLGLIHGLEANGQIKTLHIVNSIIELSVLPIAYLLGRCGYSPVSFYVCVVAAQCLSLLFMMWQSKVHLRLPVANFVVNVVCRALLVTGLLFMFDSWIWSMLTPGLWSLLLLCLADVLMALILVGAIGLNARERFFVTQKLRAHT